MTKVFAIRDVKADGYSALHVAPSVGVSVRNFSDVVNNRESSMNRYPEDFQLYELGEWDQTSGLIVCHSVPKYIMSATECKTRTPEMPILAGEVK